MSTSSSSRNLVKITRLTVLALSLLSIVHGGYVVTTPRKWTSGEANQVCITISSSFSSGDAVNIEVTGTDWSDNKAHVLLPKTSLPLPLGQTSVCHQLVLSETRITNGLITVSGSLGASKLSYSKAISIAVDVAETFVQTDKHLYKQSQTVQFRILSVSGPYLKVSNEQYEEIWIDSPSGTRISQWLDVPNKNGLIHLSFKLSNEPEEGTYIINVLSPYETIVTESFKVEKYVLPRFEVTIKPPSYILGTSKEILYEVCAKYTFGQPVKGNVTLTIDNNGWSNNKFILKKIDKISGCKVFAISADEISLNSQSYYTNSLKATAVVVEEGTGVELKSEESTVIISRTAIKFEDISVQKYFKPELPYIGEIKTTFPDGSPAANEPMEVCCGSVCKNFTTDSNGLLKFAVPPHLRGDIEVKANNYQDIKVTGSWMYVMYGSSFQYHVKRYHSPSSSSLGIALTDNELDCTVSETIDFDLPVRFASHGQTSALFTVLIISRGQIQFNKTFVQFLNTGNSLNIDEKLLLEPIAQSTQKGLVRGLFTLSIRLPKTVSPNVKVIVWYARGDGEVVSDARRIDVTECLLNSVDLTWSAAITQPGDNATLSIRAEPLSLCSLGVIDKSVELLSSKKKSITITTLLDIAERSSVEDYENLQVNDNSYCPRGFVDRPIDVVPLPEMQLLARKKRHQTVDEVSKNLDREKRLIAPWFPYFFSEDVDALQMFDEAGIYILSDLTLETRPCIRGNNNWGFFGFGNLPVNSLMGGFAEGGPIALGIPPPSPISTISSINIIDESSSDSKLPRTHFPETWLWDLFSIPGTGLRTEALTLPDTVTEWIGNAICVHPLKGVGISASSSITTFRDFFADLTLPPSVKRGEVFTVKVSVFNYLKQPLPLTLILEESSEYTILGDNALATILGKSPIRATVFGNRVNAVASGRRSACIRAEDKVVIGIRIRPKAIGDVNITVTAMADNKFVSSCGKPNKKVRKDVLVKPVRVEIEGFPKEETKSKYICTQDLNSNQDSFETWLIKIPGSIVPDSARGFVSVVGDMMGPTLENLGSLVRMPSGCGEQNMLNFAPNIFVMQYLDASHQNNKEITKKAIDFMKNGYQRELNYRHNDGSYSAFGKSDASGSTWLTAFVLKSFAQARQYISVDQNELDLSSSWLKNKQLKDGCFQSVGNVIHKGMKGGLGGTSSPALLSSFVLVALLEAGESTESIVVKEALKCLGADAPTKNPYSLAVKAYALALAGSPNTQTTIEELLSLAIDQTSTMHWELPSVYSSSDGVGVETAGYALLALITHKTNSATNYLGQARKIVKWINNQRNGQGGFISTQDTIVALQALAAFEKSSSQGPVDLTVTAIMGSASVQFTVNEENKLLTQQSNIPTIPSNVTFRATGTGCVLVQAILRYNVPEPESNEAFSLRVQSSSEPDRECKTKRLTVCASYVLKDGNSNMAIIAVNLVSGYIPIPDDLELLLKTGIGLFKRYEVDRSIVTIYVNEFSSKELCASFRVIRENDVENTKPGTVKVYDYYKPEYTVSEKFTFSSQDKCN